MEGRAATHGVTHVVRCAADICEERGGFPQVSGVVPAGRQAVARCVDGQYLHTGLVREHPSERFPAFCVLGESVQQYHPFVSRSGAGWVKYS